MDSNALARLKAVAGRQTLTLTHYGRKSGKPCSIARYSSFKRSVDWWFVTAYTWSRSIDGASVFLGSGANATTIFRQDNYNLKAERDNSDFDIRQRLSWSFSTKSRICGNCPKC